MKRLEFRELFSDPSVWADQTITVGGWVRSIRASNAFGFIELNDGTTFRNLQIVLEDAKLQNYKEIAKQNVGAALLVHGTFVLTPQAKQPFELKASSIEVELSLIHI